MVRIKSNSRVNLPAPLALTCVLLTLAISAGEAQTQEKVPPGFVATQLQNKNVVSVAFSANDKETSQTNVSQLSYIEQLKNDATLKVNDFQNVILISREFPAWYEQKNSTANTAYIQLAKSFDDGTTNIESTQENFKGASIPSTALNAFVKPYEEAPEAIVANRRQKVSDMIDSKESQLQMVITPALYFYEVGTGVFLGSTNFVEGKLYFDKAQKFQNNVPTLNWFETPRLIIPRVDISEQDSSRLIELDPKQSVWKLKDVVSFLKNQGVNFVGADTRLQNIEIYIEQNQPWNVGELLKSVCSVVGCEVKTIGGNYFFSISSAFKVVADNAEYLDREKDYRDKMLSLISRVFLLKGQNLDLLFNNDYFFAGVPKRLADIDEVTKDSALALLDPITQRKVGTIWFVPQISFRLQTSAQGSTIGVLPTPFPPDADLNPPKGWLGYKPSEFLDAYGAQIIP